MRAGSVVVDLAGESGGNSALSTPGATVVHHDVTVTAPSDLAASMPEHASELYARNVVALLELMLDEHGVLDPERDDEVLVGACVTRADPTGPVNGEEE
jgi:NAD(P) transhydrogenase subunit alpha